MGPKSKGGVKGETNTPPKQTVGFQVPNPTTAKPDDTRSPPALLAVPDSQVELKAASPGAQGGAKKAWTGRRSFQGQEGLQLPVKDVPSSGVAQAAKDSPGAFNTDAEISKGQRAELFGRELQKWEPDADGAALETLNLDSAPKGRSQRWDQFEANRRQFGVRTSFNEDIYTTKLDKSKAKISEKEAARIAAEIEGRRSSNAHLAEERGQIAYREADEDEEARYSAVQRGASALASAIRNEASAGGLPGSSQDGRKAWTNAAGSVAAVSGRPGNSSAPIDVDPRKEHNKVRMQLAGKSGSTSRDRSPYGTPKSSRSLVSPLVGNASQVEALDLNPGTARYEAGVRSEFAKFKKANKQDGNSPTDSEMAKEASASMSTKSGSAPSTPEDNNALAETAKPQGPAQTAIPAHPPAHEMQGVVRPAAGRPAFAGRGGARQEAARNPPGPSHAPGIASSQFGAHMQPNGAIHFVPGQMHAAMTVPGAMPGHMPANLPPGAGPVMPGGQPRLPVMSIPGPAHIQMQMQGNAAGSQGLARPGPARPLSFGAPIPGMPQQGAIPMQAAGPYLPQMQAAGFPRPQQAPGRGPGPPSQGSSAPSTPSMSRPATSKLNPNAKEFKLNPSAKTFTPGSSALSRVPSNASSVTNVSSIAPPTSSVTGGPVQGSPTPRGPPSSTARPPQVQMERRPSRELVGARPQSRSPPQGARFRGGTPPQMPTSAYPVVGPHAPVGPGAQPRYMPAGNYSVPFMQGSAPMFMANGQAMMPYAIAYSPPQGVYPQQGYPAGAMMYGGIPVQMGGSIPGGVPRPP